MAHKIDNSTGDSAFVSRRIPAWHGLGKVVETISTEEALKLGGLNYEVEKLPNIHRIGEKEIVSGVSFFTYRKDTLGILGDKLGKNYTVLQNADALSLVDEYIRNGGGIIETAGALNDGATTFLCVKAPEKIVIGKTDEIEQYVVFSNSHDGSRSVEAYYSPIRVVCWNTLQLALQKAKNKISIRHTSGVLDNTKKALEVLGIVSNNTALAAASYKQMAKIKMKKQEFFDYLGNLFFDASEIAELQRGKADAVSTRKKNTVGKVIEYAELGIGQKEAVPGTAWWAYNAVTGYFTNAKEFDSPDQRMESLLWNHSAATMNKAFDLALNPGRIQPLKNLNIASGLSNN